MRRTAWILVVAGLASLTIGWVGQGSNGLAELTLRKIVLEPPSAVTRGEVVAVHAWAMNTGERPAGEFRTEFFYRRQNQGESWTSFHTVLIPNLPPSQQDLLEIRDEGRTIGFDTSSLEIGTYEIRVVVDSNGLIPEWDKTNNELVTTLTIVPSRAGYSDLQPMSLSFDPPTPAGGQLVVVSSEVANTGDQNSSGFRVSFSVDDKEFDSTILDGLVAGAAVEVQGALDPYALGLGPGSHTVRVAVDSEGKVDEQDEANNELVASLTIEGAELRPISLGFGRSLVHLDEPVTVTSRVRNVGKAEASVVEVAFLVDGVQFALANVGALGPGAEATASAELLASRPDLSLSPGAHEVRAVVDPHGLVPETDKTNNVAWKSLSILPEERRLAELHPESLELNPPSPVEVGKADAVTVSSVLKNTGKATAKGFAVEFGYRVMGALRWETMPCRDVAGCDRLDLSPGAEMKVEGTFPVASVAPGLYEVRVLVDPYQGCNLATCGDYGRVEEIDETNNELVSTLVLLVARLPDLALDPTQPLVVAPGNTVKRGQTLRLAANLSNLGDADAAAFDVEFSYAYVPLLAAQAGMSVGTQGVQGQPPLFTRFAAVSNRGLSVGKKATAQAILETVDLRPGTYLIRVELDPTSSDRPVGRVRERVETNNILDAPFLVQGPDLVPAGLLLGPVSPVAAGQKVTLKALVANIGVEAAGTFRVDFSWCETIDPTGPAPQVECHSVGSVSFPGLAVNSPQPAEWVLDTSALAPGDYLIRVVVDPDDGVAEQNEQNNVVLVPLVISGGGTVGSGADLVPGTLAFESLFSGQRRVLATVTNQGKAAAGPSTVQLIYEQQWDGGLGSGAVVFYSGRVAGLEPGQAASIQADLRTTTLADGVYRITLVVDAGNEVPESNEKNNSTSELISVP